MNSVLFSLVSFCLGIALHEILPYSPAVYLWTAVLLGVIYLDLFILNEQKNYTKILLLISCLCLGIGRAQLSIHIPNPSSVDYYASEEPNKVSIIGTIAEEPDLRRNKVNYTVKAQSIKILNHPNPDSSESPPSTNGESQGTPHSNAHHIEESYLLVSSGKYPRYQYGDQIEVSGHLRHPPRFDTFDYAGYLSRYHIYSVIYRPYIKPANNEEAVIATLSETKSSRTGKQSRPIETLWSWFFSHMLKIKASFEQQMNRTFSTEPSSSFMAGLLLGSRKGIPPELSESFRITGLTHIIAISGYNITLIASILMGIFKPFGRKPSIIISALGITLFTLFVGASPAVVRACIMGLIALLALNSDRKGQITLTLIITVVLMIGWNPKILRYDVGFQLSFLATMGLIYVAPLIEKYFLWIPETLALRESILLTMSAQIMALPIILYNFQSLSLISPISNLMVAGPVLPLAMLFGFIGTVVSYIFLPIAKLIAFPAYLLLQYITWIINLTAKVPYANIDITWFTKPFFVAYSIGLTYLLLKYWKQIHRRELNIIRLKNGFQHKLCHHAFALTNRYKKEA